MFSGDASGDSVSGNDLIYIPRNQSEMNFVTFTANNPHLHGGGAGCGVRPVHRGGPVSEQSTRSVRGAWCGVLPVLQRVDWSLTQDVFQKAHWWPAVTPARFVWTS